MGADLYLQSIFQRQQNLYYESFREAARLRDSFPREDKKNRDAAQEEVERLYELMYEKGYFRDSYNSTNFLNKLGLSWWRDIVPRLRKRDGCLSIRQAKWFLKQLYTRFPECYPEAFNQFCEENNAAWGDQAEAERNAWDEFFHGKFESLTALLRMSIELSEPIECSL